MHKDSGKCLDLFLRVDERPRTFRPGTWIFGQEYRYQTEYFKGAPFLLEYIPILINSGGPREAFEVYRKPNVERDGHKGGGATGQIRHEADLMSFFIGMDSENPEELNADMSYHMGLRDNEVVYDFDKSSCVFIPRGICNGPQVFSNLKRTVMFLNIFTQPSKEACYIEHIYHGLPTAKKEELTESQLREYAASNPEMYKERFGEEPSFPDQTPLTELYPDNAAVLTKREGVFGQADVSSTLSYGAENFKDAPYHVNITYIKGNTILMPGTDKGEEKPVWKDDAMFNGYNGPYPQYCMEADRYVFFFGTNVKDLKELGGHVKCMIGDDLRDAEETFEFDEPKCVYIPQGVRFGPVDVSGFKQDIVMVDVIVAPTMKAAKVVPDFTYFSEFHDQEKRKRLDAGKGSPAKMKKADKK